jgi:ClpP class serine protease
MDVAYFQDYIDAAFDQFKAIVTGARGAQLTKPIGEIANGKIYTGPAALKLGLVDQIGYPQDAWSYAAGKAGLKKHSVVKYEEPNSLMDLLGAKSSVPAPSSSSSTSTGTTVNLNVNLDLHKILNGQTAPMYLFRIE